MKKKLAILAVLTLLGACTSTEKTDNKTTAKVTVKKEAEVNVTKEAMLIPINNTNDQNTAKLLWSELSKGLSANSDKFMTGQEVEKLVKAAGYTYGDQLTQLDTVEKKLNFQTKLNVEGLDGLVFLTVNEIDSSLSKNPFSPKTTRIVKAKAVLYVNGVEARTYDIEGTETKKISKEVLSTILTIGGAFATDKDMEAVIISIMAITDPAMRTEVAEAVLAMSGSLGTKLETLMLEKGILKESPYQVAINNAVENATKAL